MFSSFEELVKKAEDSGKKISEIILETEAEETELPKEELISRMKNNLSVMRKSASIEKRCSASGLSGESGWKYSLSDKKGALMGSLPA